MKRLLLPALLLCAHAGTAFGADRLIENHGFGLFGAEEGTEGPQAVLFLHNEDCIGSYKVASREVVLGEGKIDFRKTADFIIPFGANDLRVSCTGGNRLRVVAR